VMEGSDGSLEAKMPIGWDTGAWLFIGVDIVKIGYGLVSQAYDGLQD